MHSYRVIILILGCFEYYIMRRHVCMQTREKTHKSGRNKIRKYSQLMVNMAHIQMDSVYYNARAICMKEKNNFIHCALYSAARTICKEFYKPYLRHTDVLTNKIIDILKISFTNKLTFYQCCKRKKEFFILHNHSVLQIIVFSNT